MATITRDDIVSTLGPVEDDVMAEILRIGASREELVEARNWMLNNEALMNTGHPLASARVSRLITLLESVEDDAPAGRRDPED